jgi:hypothetical protein
MASYADGVEWCLYPWGLVSGRPQPPTVLIEIDPAATSALQFASIPDPGAGSLTLEDLAAPQPGSPRIPINTHYTAAFTSDRRSVVVSLTNLDTLTPGLKNGDRYQGEIQFGVKKDVIAKVLVIVKA